MSNEENAEQKWRLLPLKRSNPGHRAELPPLPRGLVEAFDLWNRKIYVRLSSVLMIQSFNEEVSGKPCVRVFLGGVDEPMELQGSIDGVSAMVWYEDAP